MKTKQAAKHTPGPWKVEEWNGAKGQRFLQVNGAWEDVESYDAMTGKEVKTYQTVARLGDAKCERGDIMRSDARLIAAAPELYEAAKFALAILSSKGVWASQELVSAERKLDAAIARAEGRA